MQWLRSFMKLLNAYSEQYHPNVLDTLPFNIPTIEGPPKIERPENVEVPVREGRFYKIVLRHFMKSPSIRFELRNTVTLVERMELEREAQEERRKQFYKDANVVCRAYRKNLRATTILRVGTHVDKAVLKATQPIDEHPTFPPLYKASIKKIVDHAANKVKSQIDAIEDTIINCDLKDADLVSDESARDAIKRNAFVYYSECVKFGDYFWDNLKHVCLKVSKKITFLNSNDRQ